MTSILYHLFVMCFLVNTIYYYCYFKDVTDKAAAIEPEDEEDDEDLGYTDTYAEYMPSKCKSGMS